VADDLSMSIREPRVGGSRTPDSEPVRVMITLDAESARALDLAAGNSGEDRYEFVMRTVDEAIGRRPAAS
jgi:hypothetical protein